MPDQRPPFPSDVGVDGPFILKLKDGTEVEILRDEGGGMSYDPDDPMFGRYEISVLYPDGDSGFIPQDQIESMRSKWGDIEYEFGNPFMPGHPRPRDDENGTPAVLA